MLTSPNKSFCLARNHGPRFCKLSTFYKLAMVCTSRVEARNSPWTVPCVGCGRLRPTLKFFLTREDGHRFWRFSTFHKLLRYVLFTLNVKILPALFLVWRFSPNLETSANLQWWTPFLRILKVSHASLIHNNHFEATSSPWTVPCVEVFAKFENSCPTCNYGHCFSWILDTSKLRISCQSVRNLPCLLFA